MIGRYWEFFLLIQPIKGSGHAQGIQPQACTDGQKLDVQFFAAQIYFETHWPFTQFYYPLVGWFPE